jgi:uncharacterized membrane protein YphA (DoxX/SURF4 family)
MINPSQHSMLHRIALLLVRLSFGAYLFFAGFNKLYVKGGSLGAAIDAWMKKYNDTLPDWLDSGWANTIIATPYGYALPWLEIILGLLLALGLFFRATSAVLTFLLATIAIAVVTQAGNISGADKLGVHHSIVMACFAFLLIFTGPGGFSLDSMLPRRRRNR